MQEFKVKIGIEVHAQLSTDTKLFCRCSTKDANPNENVCPVCLGLPGVLPVLNRKAVDYAIKASLALNCKIHNVSIFARKHYFYPDLPKGYQITQYDKPLATDGWIKINSKKIRIRRVHLEEDAGKLIHEIDKSYVDFNRCGVPLIEIVTEPDISSPEEAVLYLKKLQLILRYLKVSDADMEKGNFRCEPNVSVTIGEEEGVRTEIKNLNSFKAVKEAIQQAIARQKQMIERGESIKMQTMLWDEKKKKLIVMRKKEEEADYRYFPEPDLPPLLISQERIENIRKEIPELPDEKSKRFQEVYLLKKEDVNILIENPTLADFFEDTAKFYKNFSRLSHFIINDLIGLLKEKQKDFHTIHLLPQEMAELLKAEDERKITKMVIREFIRKKIDGKEVNIKDILKEENGINIKEIVEEVIKSNPDIVEKFKKGKEGVLGFLIGETMKRLKGRGDPRKVKEELLRRLR